MGYGYDDRFYDRGVSRNNSMDAASRVASEIFQHDLMGASRDTRQILSQTSSRDADAFVQQVNRKVEQMNQYYGQQDDGCTNFLSARHSYDRYGRPTERISMANSDGESRGIVDVPMQPYGRVPMNFSGYQPGEQPGAGYYDNQQAYNGFRPQPQVPYDGGYDQYQNYQQQAFLSSATKLRLLSSAISGLWVRLSSCQWQSRSWPRNRKPDWQSIPHLIK